MKIMSISILYIQQVQYSTLCTVYCTNCVVNATFCKELLLNTPFLRHASRFVSSLLCSLNFFLLRVPRLFPLHDFLYLHHLPNYVTTIPLCVVFCCYCVFMYTPFPIVFLWLPFRSSIKKMFYPLHSLKGIKRWGIKSLVWKLFTFLQNIAHLLWVLNVLFFNLNLF